MTSAGKLLAHLTVFDYGQRLVRGRWIGAALLIAGLSYLAIDGALAVSAQAKVSANVWDAFFSIFGNQYQIFYVHTPLILYLTSDIAVNLGFGATVFLKVGSRRTWWLSKTLTLALTIASYILAVATITTVLAAFTLPFSLRWSQAITEDPVYFQLNPGGLSLPPFFALAILLSLLMLGWLTLGLISMIVTQKTGQPMYGFLAGVMLFFVSISSWGFLQRPPLSNVLLQNHLLFSLHAIGDSKLFTLPLSVSFMYWSVLISAFFTFGYWGTLKKDHY